MPYDALNSSSRQLDVHHDSYCISDEPLKEHHLQEVAEIWPGYPFRGKLPLSEKGEAFVVQFRHIVVGDSLRDETGAELDRAHLTGRKKPNFLRSGDVLFMAKGTRNFATTVVAVPKTTVCTPNFYHVRIRSRVPLLEPEFLAWQLNHWDAQRYFSACSQGSVAPSVTKSQLGHLPIVIPPLEQQRRIANLARAAFQEEQLLSQLVENRRRMVAAAGHQILHSTND